MGLTALIAAYHESEEPGGPLRATLPLAGRTLVERQARLAASAGADPVVILVERLPPELTGAIDRLRGEGMKVRVARSAEEAAEAVQSTDRLLLIGDGLIASEPLLARLVGLEGYALMTVPDVVTDDRYERIDAHSRWAGLAIVDGEMLKRTAAMLRDWDLQSTLLRRIVQAGARQLSMGGAPEEADLIVAERASDLAGLEAKILSGAGGHRSDWVSRFLLAPLESWATRRLMPTGVSAAAIGLADTLLTALGTLAFAWHWLGLGLAFLLLATPLEGIADRLAALRLQGPRRGSWWASLLPLLAAASLLACGYTLADSRGWGCMALAATALAFVAALRIELGGKPLPGGAWLAERKGMAWLMLPFAVANLWGTGLTALALYAGASFFWAQRQVHGRPAPRGQD